MADDVVDEPTAEEEPAAPAEESPEEHILRAMDVAESGAEGAEPDAADAEPDAADAEPDEGGGEPAED